MSEALKKRIYMINKKTVNWSELWKITPHIVLWKVLWDSFQADSIPLKVAILNKTNTTYFRWRSLTGFDSIRLVQNNIFERVKIPSLICILNRYPDSIDSVDGCGQNPLNASQLFEFYKCISCPVAVAFVWFYVSIWKMMSIIDLWWSRARNQTFLCSQIHPIKKYTCCGYLHILKSIPSGALRSNNSDTHW